MQQKFVALIRVSTKKQGRSGIGLKAQRTPIRAYVEKENGTLIREFKEIESGNKRAKKRTVLFAALEFCRKHKAILLVARPDRLTRNATIGCAILEGDVEIRSVDMPHASKFQLRLFFVLAELEWDTIQGNAVRTVSVKRQNKTKLGTDGKKLALYFKKMRKQQDKKLAPVIRALRKKGYSIRRIAQDLSRRGFKRLRGSRNWTESAVHNIMQRNGIK